ncbi:hypothetical protein CCUS01_09817 [Colletotrichum cuscutae]|uniref:Uncharacterized protein n=1 Tax=Colletotrichum cuscutae TaxID=1209917 RepID=A0AAI9UEI4_9PEZI|nr:hypothetical protein CCUS01_09817 [Colletotrichum cuscutae]
MIPPLALTFTIHHSPLALSLRPPVPDGCPLPCEPPLPILRNPFTNQEGSPGTIPVLAFHCQVQPSRHTLSPRILTLRYPHLGIFPTSCSTDTGASSLCSAQEKGGGGGGNIEIPTESAPAIKFLSSLPCARRYGVIHGIEIQRHMAEMQQSFRHSLTTLLSSCSSFSCVSRPGRNCQLTPVGCLMGLSSVRFNAQTQTFAADHNPRAAASHYCTPYGCVPLHHFPLIDCHSHSGTPGACIPACSISIALLLIYPLKVPAVLPFSFPFHL